MIDISVLTLHVVRMLLDCWGMTKRTLQKVLIPFGCMGMPEIYLQGSNEENMKQKRNENISMASFLIGAFLFFSFFFIFFFFTIKWLFRFIISERDARAFLQMLSNWTNWIVCRNTLKQCVLFLAFYSFTSPSGRVIARHFRRASIGSRKWRPPGERQFDRPPSTAPVAVNEHRAKHSGLDIGWTNHRRYSWSHQSTLFLNVYRSQSRNLKI